MAAATSPLPSPYPNPTFPPRATASTSTSLSTAASNPSAPAALDVNKSRIMNVANHIARHAESGFRLDERELLKLCFALARGIDYAVSHDDIAPIAHDLPAIIKKVYQHKDNSFLRAAIMVLLISVKNACGKKWFHTEDSAELMLMANEMSSSFCIGNKILSESSNALQVMLRVMPRYFPKLKLNNVIASFEVKAGYEVLLADIYIPRNKSLEQRIRLFIAQSDDISSSTCIISPSQVNFLVNGKGVERRTIVSMDNGPQLPTDITKMLKYGLNLFQAAGSFTGNYIVTISVMEDIASLDASLLQDYVELDVAADMSDAEVIVGPSRISLNCPISHKQIKTPIKGHLCKHRQCFDFNDYMEMNSKTPSWRCPHCNQSVSYMDIRIDQKMVKILADAGESVSLVIISADGTWAAADKNQSNAIQMHKQTHTGQHENNACTEPSGVVCDPNDIMDLTTDENCESDPVLNSRHLDSQIGCLIQGGSSSEIIDKKLCQGDNISGTLEPALEVSEIGSGSSSSAFTSGLLMSVRTSGHLLTSPVNSFVDASSLGVGWNRSCGTVIPELVAQSTSQSRQAAINLQLQQQQPASIFRNESQRLLIPRNVSRNPIAIQALPAMQNQNLAKRPRICEINTSFDTNGSFITASQSARISNAGTTGMTSPTQHQSVMQPFSCQSCTFNLPAQNQVNSSTTPDQIGVTEHGGRFLQPRLNVQSPRQRQLSAPGQQTLSQLANQIRPSLQFPSTRLQQASQLATAVASANSVSQLSNLSSVKRASTLISRLQPGIPPPRVQQASQPAISVASANSVSQVSSLSTVERASTSLISRLHPRMPPPRAPPRAFMTAAPTHVTINRFRPSVGEQVQNVGGGSQETAMRSGSVPESATDSNWRPTGRMRGSLTGDAYSAAISRYTAQTLQTMTSSLSSPTAPSGLSWQATPFNSNGAAQTPPQNPVDGTAG